MEIEVTVKIIIPIAAATDEQIQEWLEYEFGARANISLKNPLYEHNADPYDLRY